MIFFCFFLVGVVVQNVLEQMHALAGSLERGSIERASGVARPA